LYYDSISFIYYFDCFIGRRTYMDFIPVSFLRNFTRKEKDKTEAAYAA